MTRATPFFMFLMPLDDNGFSKRFGWINDRFGVSWQLNLAS
jgi:predicted 3-demethylubiquinone-9 3-methyltransferase (glyoxalase superfamily)